MVGEVASGDKTMDARTAWRSPRLPLPKLRVSDNFSGFVNVYIPLLNASEQPLTCGGLGFA